MSTTVYLVVDDIEEGGCSIIGACSTREKAEKLEELRGSDYMEIRALVLDDHVDRHEAGTRLYKVEYSTIDPTRAVAVEQSSHYSEKTGTPHLLAHVRKIHVYVWAKSFGEAEQLADLAQAAARKNDL